MASTLNLLVLSSDSTTRDEVSVDASQPTHTKEAPKNVESAVFSYIQAVRALGHTTVNTMQIAEALSLPLATVEHTIESLRKKGVKKLDV